MQGIWAGCTAVIWGAAVPLMLYSNASAALFWIWIIIGGLMCLLISQTFFNMYMMCHRDGSDCGLVSCCTMCLTLAGFLTFTIGGASFWWLVKDGIVDGCTLATGVAQLQGDGIYAFNCNDGYVPTSQQVPRATAFMKMSGMNVCKGCGLMCKVAPIYVNSSMIWPPVALSVTFDGGKREMDLKVEDVHSPGPDCGNWGTGYCGFTLEGHAMKPSRQVTGAITSSDIEKLAREAAKTHGASWGGAFEDLAALPIFVSESPAKVLTVGKNTFIAGIILMVCGSSVWGLVCFCCFSPKGASPNA